MPKPLTALMVEDVQDDVDMLLDELRRAGFETTWYRVETEADFVAGIKKLPDIIFSDYSMPRFTGLQAADILQKSGLDIPFILISGTVGEDVAVEAMHHGATDYLLKDRITRLGSAVERALEQKRLRNEYKKAEDEVRWKTAFLEAQIDSAIDGILVVDRNGQRILQNQRSIDIWKIPPHVAEDKNDAAQIQFAITQTKNPDEFIKRVSYLYNHPDEIGKDEIELIDGTIIERYSSPVRDKAGNHYGRIWTFRDITERKQAEIVIRKSEQEQRALAAQLEVERARLVAAQTVAKVGSWEMDLSTMDLIWSDEIYRIFETTPEQYSPTHKGFLQFVHPEEREKVDHIFLQSLDNRRPGAFEHRIVMPDGRVKYLEERWEVIRDGQEKPVRALGTCQDVSERKRMELRFRRLVDSNAQGVMFWGTGGEVTGANDAFLRLIGYTREDLKTGHIGWESLTPPEYAERDQRALEEVAATGICVPYEKEYIRKDGTRVPILIGAASFEDNPNEGISFVLDLTERKKSENQLTLLNTCISKLNDVVMITEAEPIDEPGPRIVFLNKAFERMTGYTIAETLGRTPRLLQGQKTERHALNEIRQAMEQRLPIRREIINYAKDGTEYWLDIDIVPIFDATGKCTHFVAIERDITGEKKAEEQIAEQAAFMDKARDAILVRDLEGNILYWNKGAERMYGWTRQEVIGRNIAQLLYANPKRLDEVKSMTISQGEWSGEVQHLTKDRRELVIETSWTLIRDHTGQPKSLLAINTDVTARKKIEAQFMRAQRMESIGTLAGGVAHDLNNILAPILMSIDILKLSSTDPQAKNVLETIGVSAKRGADIVRQVLSFARGMEGERIEVQPKHLLKDIETIIKDTFPKNIRLEVSVPNDSWTILGDPTQLHQIFLNLCVNGRDAMPEGGSLTVTVENTVLDEQYAAMHIQAKAGRYVCINVTDSGTGIPPAILDKIFDPFFTTKEVGKGTGLGLSTAMAIVNSHGGFVNVYSELGKGATFKVYLPAMEASSGSRKATVELPELPRGNGETVLVVDDEASILTITKQTLEAFGYRILTASDGAEAVALYAQHQDKIAVVLTDVAMPIMDGAATIRALRRVNPAIKIIAASGLHANSGVTTLSGDGVKHFLTKPYTSATLLKALQAILNEV